MPYSTKTTYYLDLVDIREFFKSEFKIRTVTLREVSDQTGIHEVALGQFKNGHRLLSADAALTLVKWGNGNVNNFLKRRGNAYKHNDTPDQRQIRIASQFLNSLGAEIGTGETVIDAMVRLLGEAKSRGLFEDGVNE